MATLMKGSALTKPAASCASRVRPFTAANGRKGRSVRPSKHSTVARAAAAEEAPAEEAVQEQVVVEDDFKFNYTDAKRQNQFESSDVEVALKWYADRSFEVPSSLPYEQDVFTNRLGSEDAAFFDEYDDNPYYKSDGFASAGIPEAAPKTKRQGRQGADAESDEVDEEFRELEDSKLVAAAYDEMGVDISELDGDGDAPWDWADSEGTVVGAELALPGSASSSGMPDEEAIFADLARLQLDSMQEIPEDDREVMAMIVDPELLNDVDQSAEVAPLPELDTVAAQLTEAEAAEIDALLAEEVPTIESLGLPADLGIEPEELALGGLDAKEVTEYLAALEAFDVNASGSSAEEVEKLLGSEIAVPVTAVTDIPTLDDLPAEPDVSAVLAIADPQLPADFDREELEADAAAVRSVIADVNAVEGIELLPMDMHLNPIPEDLEAYGAILAAAEEYIALDPVAMTEEVTNREADNPVNMYDSIDPSLIRVPLSAELGDDEEAGLVERILELGRVTKVVKGGKLQGFRCVCVVGNGAGRVGVGVQAGRDIGTAVKRALVDAKKNMIDVPLVGAGTIPHKVETYFKAAGVVMLPAREGTGVIAGGAVRSVLEVAGVKNVLAKRLGSRSSLNNARATMKALSELRTMEDYASARDMPVEYMLA